MLEAIYAAFAEGWSDPAGTEARRRNLADEGIWLGRLVASLLPDEPEALGLLALMLHAQARRDARRDAQGEYVPLAEQDPARWDAALIDEAEALLARASALPGTGRYQLEAAVQSAHVVRRRTGRSDWAAIERIYDALLAHDRLAGGGDQPRRRGRRDARRRRRPRGARRARGRPAPRRLSALLGRARRTARARPATSTAADAAYERAIGLEADPAVRRFLEQRRSGDQKAPLAPRAWPPAPPPSSPLPGSRASAELINQSFD